MLPGKECTYNLKVCAARGIPDAIDVAPTPRRPASVVCFSSPVVTEQSLPLAGRGPSHGMIDNSRPSFKFRDGCGCTRVCARIGWLPRAGNREEDAGADKKAQRGQARQNGWPRVLLVWRMARFSLVAKLARTGPDQTRSAWGKGGGGRGTRQRRRRWKTCLGCAGVCFLRLTGRPREGEEERRKGGKMLLGWTASRLASLARLTDDAVSLTSSLGVQHNFIRASDVGAAAAAFFSTALATRLNPAKNPSHIRRARRCTNTNSICATQPSVPMICSGCAGQAGKARRLVVM